MGQRPGWLAGPDTWLAGPEAWLAGPDAWLASPEAWPAGPEAWLARTEASQPGGGDKRTKEGEKISPFYRTLSPIGATVQKPECIGTEGVNVDAGLELGDTFCLYVSVGSNPKS